MSANVLEEIIAGRLTGIPRMNVVHFERYMESGMAGEGVKCELIDGYPVIKNRAATGEDPMNIGTRHMVVVNGLTSWLSFFLRGTNWCVSSQNPLFMAEYNLLEPDLVIIPGRMADYAEAYPTADSAALIIEVADSSVAEDREIKLQKYARNRAPVYWIVNIRDEQIEVYEVPNRDQSIYEISRIWHHHESVPLNIPGLPPQMLSVKSILSATI